MTDEQIIFKYDIKVSFCSLNVQCLLYPSLDSVSWYLSPGPNCPDPCQFTSGPCLQLQWTSTTRSRSHQPELVSDLPARGTAPLPIFSPHHHNHCWACPQPQETFATQKEATPIRTSKWPFPPMSRTASLPKFCIPRTFPCSMSSQLTAGPSAEHCP